MSGPETALAACRALHDAATMLLWGAFAYLALLVPPALSGTVGRRLDPLRRGAIVVAVATVAARLPLEVAAIGNGWADASDPAMIVAVLVDTSVGRAWWIEAAAAALLGATLAIPPGRRPGATALAAGLLLATLALTGHAAMHEGALGILQRLNDAVHLLAGGAWVGALVPLLPVLRALHDPACHHEAAVALRRFSAAGHGAVALVVATGVVNTVLVLGRWPTDWSSPYQALLAAKVALVAVMIALALVNRYVIVPGLGRGERVAILRRASLAEIGLALAVIACVGVFGLLEPA